MIIYRIENPVTNHGMWYREDGTYDPFIKTLTEGISSHLPMEYCERYGKNGRRWYSGCKDLEQLKTWFSNKDVEELLEGGYRLYEFECEEYTVEDNQVLFTREGVLNKKEIQLVKT